ncbi:MAG: efflux RND transporter periplasmic adaptor subunit [Bacteroidales bacterium]|nr:efflux RND transporter periplasmic adaptor subunit [Bacteroidales bacterium]
MKAVRLILALAGLCLLTVSCKKTEAPRNEVMRGDLRQTLFETGELVTADTRTFVMPRFGRYWSNFKIIGMLEHGTEVTAGDSIIQLDPADVKQFIINQETRLETQKANLEKFLVNNAIQLKNLDNNLRSQEAAFNLTKLQMASSKFETEKNQRIRQLNFRQAEIRYEKVLRNIEYTKKLARYDEKIQRIQTSQIQSLVDMAYEVLPKLTIRTPINGIFQVGQTRRRNGVALKVGDEVRVGNSMGSVPDLTWMKVNTTVNEVDRTKIREGMPVVVRMDAMPDLKFGGIIEKIGILCHEYSYEDSRKVFDVVVRLNESDLRLKPGMTVSCEFVAHDLKDVLYVPNDCLLRENGRYYVYHRDLAGLHKIPVRFVTRNNVFSVIEGDIHEGMNVEPLSTINLED